MLYPVRLMYAPATGANLPTIASGPEIGMSGIDSKPAMASHFVGRSMPGSWIACDARLSDSASRWVGFLELVSSWFTLRQGVVCLAISKFTSSSTSSNTALSGAENSDQLL